MGLAGEIGRDRRMNNLEQLLIDALPKGCEYALKAREIGQITGFNPREIRLIVNRLRQNGELIASGNYGYFVPDLNCKLCKSLFKESAKRNRMQSIELGSIAGILEKQINSFKV